MGFSQKSHTLCCLPIFAKLTFPLDQTGGWDGRSCRFPCPSDGLTIFCMVLHGVRAHLQSPAARPGGTEARGVADFYLAAVQEERGLLEKAIGFLVSVD